jgi:GAF domain-containing protein
MLDAIARTAARLCDANDAIIFQIEGERIRWVARHGRLRAASEVWDFPVNRRSVVGRAVVDRRTVHTRDLAQAVKRTFPDARAAQRATGVRTILTAPLLHDGAALGAIVVRRTRVRPFNAKQIALLRTFADQAAIAIENVRLSNTLGERNAALTEALGRQTATGDILRVISSSPTNLQPVLDTIAADSLRLCDGLFSSVYRFDGELIHMEAQHNYSPLALEESRRLFPTRPTRALFSARAILERAVVHVPDVEQDADHRARHVTQELDFRSVLSVPMLRDGGPIGAITVWRAAVGPFSDAQVALLQTFADQAVIAIENVRLFKELEARNRDLSTALDRETATGDILRVISSSPTDLEPVARAIAESAGRLCDCTHTDVFRFDGERIHWVASHGRTEEQQHTLSDAWPRRPRPDTLVGRTILGRGTLHLHDATTDPHATARAPLSIRSFLGVPMLRSGEPVGVIGLTRSDVRPFSEREIALVQTFADQAVIAIENVRLFRELESRNDDLTEALEQQTATAEILRLIGTSPTDAQPVFDGIARSAVKVLDALACAVFVIEGDTVGLVATHGVPGQRLERFRTQFPAPLSAQPEFVTTVREGLFHLADIEHNSEATPAQIELARLGGYGARLMAPMMRGGSALGVIAVTRTQPDPFSPRQIELLQTFADQAVIAIENVRLFTELEARNRDLATALDRQTATGEVLRVISSSPTDVQPVFDAIMASAVRLCGALFGTLFRVDGDLVRVAAFLHPRPEEAEAIYPAPLASELPTCRAIRENIVVHVADVEQPGAVPAVGLQIARAASIRSLLVVPMRREDTPIGAILIARPVAGLFPDEQVALLQTFADQSVIAIQNVRLFTQLQERNREVTEALERQTATGEILNVISSSPTDVRPVFDTIARNAARLCGDGSWAVVTRFDGELVHLVAQHNARGDAATMEGLFPIPLSEPSSQTRAIRECAVVHIPDIEHERYGDLADRARTVTARSLLTVPLLRDGKPIGSISASKATAGAFSDAQVALMETFADQAVIAIENVRLFTELERRNAALTEALEQQTATSEILRVISSSPDDVQPVFDAIAANAARLCDAANGLVIRFDGQLLHLAAQYNVDPERLAAVKAAYPRPPSRGALSGRAILTRAVVHVADVSQDPEYALPTATTIGYASVLAVPMLHEGVPRGTILVARDVVAPFSEAHIALIQTFADQAVIAIENVRLFTELQARTAQLSRSVDELTALGEVSRALSSTLDLETVLTTIATRASQLAGTDAVSVYEYDEPTEAFHWRATANLDEQVESVARRTPIPRGVGAQGRMAVTRAPVQIADIAAEDAYQGPLRDVLLRTGTRAVLAVPLLRDDRLVGGLTVNKKTPGEFPPETIELLKTFASQSALAINNARLFREIADKGRQLEIASRHKSQFLANMSHELRTPLNAILGYTELISDGIYGEVPERMSEVLERVDKSGRHLLGLINDILDLSKIEAGQLTLALGPYAMDAVAQTVATQVGSLAAEKPLGFELALDDDLPIGQGDERRLTQVLLNLVGNAIKFTDVGKVAVRVSTRGDAYVVSVTDTGPGIAEADREKIFEEFQQADTTRAKAKGGTGLGLAISRRIVEMHGGRLWVESTLGEGSTFAFTVPVRVERQVDVARAGEAR